MKFPPFLHSHHRLTLLGTPPNRVFFVRELQRCGIQTFGGSAGWQRDEILRTVKNRRISFGIECSVEKLTGWKLADWDDHLSQGCWRLLGKHKSI